MVATSGGEERRQAGSAAARIGEILFPRRGFSATEILIAANVLVAAWLLAAWGPGYGSAMARWAANRWHEVHANGAYAWWLPTLFLHADSGHLARNMVALLAASGAVEFLAGGRWALGVYLLTGIAGAWASYLSHGAPPLSIGASGAIFGLLGCAVAFLIRRRAMFNYAQQWKVWRVYVPLFVLLYLPALANADVSAHAGGFVFGLLLGPWIPPHARIPALAEFDTLRDEEEAPEGDVPPGANASPDGKEPRADWVEPPP